ncbi:MAG: EAL domain-containing protein [Comamonadaceae bacterium]|nr:MAG: EAL domain-containing protein [Comamonadaceae bacterium]
MSRSLKTRVTLFTLTIFVLGVWALTFFASRMLQGDMQRLLGEQQFSTVSVLAQNVNDRLTDRLRAVNAIADQIDADLLVHKAMLQTRLEERPILSIMFNAGTFITGVDGVAIASLPVSAGRIGVNYLDRDFIVAALKEGRASVGQPVMGKQLKSPVIVIAAPIRDRQGKVIGALAGVTDLGQPNFLDQITYNRYGQSGGYLLNARKERLIVTATDKTRIMQPLPPVGVNPLLDRYMQGFEGYGLSVNSRGVEELTSAKGIPVAGWLMGVVTPAAEAFAPIDDMQLRMLLASLCLTLLAGLLTWWMLKRQLEPLTATADAMVALSSRKQIPQALPVCGQDEIGQLTGGFNRLVETWIEREEALLKSEERWKFAIDGAGDGLWDWNTQTGEAFFSPRYKQMFGYADADFGATSDEWSKRIHPDEAPGVFAAIQPYMEGKPGAASVEFRMLCKDGSWKWVLGRGMVVNRDADGKPLRMIGTNSDITVRKAHQSQLEHLAHFDALTNLPNRVLLADRLQQAMAQALRRAQHLAVAYLDLDGFKTINDQHGHDVGDQVLIALAQRMRQVLREGDSLARIGGDEFVIALLDVDDRVASLPMLNRLKAACAQNVQVGALSLQVSVSVGITFYPQAQDIDADQLLRQSDQAMYQAKLAGKNRLHFFDTTQDSSIRGRHESVERIRLALELHEFVLHYQPKVNMRSGQIVGAEALIRWQHPEKGLLSPAMFLPLIEDHPLAVDIGEWVIDTSLTQIERWHAAGLDMRVSVNVGSRQLQQSDFVDRLKFILAKHPQVKPSSLELEVLETSALEDIAQVSDVIEACERIGVKFALDDFGTGYSSLSYLKLLRVATLKIDQSFVRDMLEDPDDLAILRGVIGLAAAFKRQVIAEGVETVAHGTLLLQLGCELAQGYGIAQPMSAEQMPAWSTAWRPDAAWRDFCRRTTRNRAARRAA